MSSEWHADGVRVVPGDTLDDRTPQTPGRARAAEAGARTGTAGLWAWTGTVAPSASTGAHQHGNPDETISSAEALIGCSAGTLRHTGPQARRPVGHDEQALEA